MGLVITNFKFKPIKAKRMSTGIKRISQITTGLVSVENGVYTCHVFNDNQDSSSGDLKLRFTDKSYELKGRETIFDRVRYETDKKKRYIRTKIHAMSFPGSSDLYVPFAPNWIVKGYIVEIAGEKYFDFVDLVTLNGYN